MNVSSVLHCMPAVVGFRAVRYRNGTNTNIREVLEDSYPAALRITKKCAELFRGNTDRESAANVWNFLKENITYKADGSRSQDIRLPNRLLKEKTGDCKSLALFAAVVLANLGLSSVGFRYVSFKSNPTPTHVYCIAYDKHGEEIIIDAVWRSFDSEPNSRSKTDSIMEVAVMGNISFGSAEHIIRTRRALRDRLNLLPVQSVERAPIISRIKNLNSILLSDYGITGKARPKGKGKENMKKIFSGFKKVALSPVRNSYILLVDLNVRGTANRLAHVEAAKPGSLRKVWEKMGGNYDKLLKAIEKGKKKKALLGEKELHGIGVAPAIPAAIAAAGTAIATIAAEVKKIFPKGLPLPDGTVKSVLNHAIYPQGTVEAAVAAAGPMSTTDRKGLKMKDLYNQGLLTSTATIAPTDPLVTASEELGNDIAPLPANTVASDPESKTSMLLPLAAGALAVKLFLL